MGNMNSTLGSHQVVAGVSLANRIPTMKTESAAEPVRSNPDGDSARTFFWLAALTALGALGLSPVFMRLWDTWSNDPLRSIGMLIVPASVILTLRVWRQMQWELNGTWWGLVPLVAALALATLGLKLRWSVAAGAASVNILPTPLSLYFFASGVILLFAGVGVWRRAWFPLALLVLAQPVPSFFNRYFDLPLQDLSAHIARSFAGLIGFPPLNKELLRLMFSPSFGMFIAPGCDGLRGAVTLGYVALIAGYLRRVRAMRWIASVCGAVLLGYLFNLIRLCTLVLYYRIALGHAALESFAKQTDYAIGGILIVAASLLFLWAVARKGAFSTVPDDLPVPDRSATRPSQRVLSWRIGVFAVVAAVSAAPGTFAMKDYQKSLVAAVRDGDLSAAQLDNLMPKEAGSYKLNRAWQEQSNGRVALETGAYESSAPGEIIVGVWLPPGQHSMHESWRTHGEDAEMRANKSFLTAGNLPVSFETAFYSDGITDSFAGNALCTPTSCLPLNEDRGIRMHFTFDPIDFNTRGIRAIPIFFRVEMPHSGATGAAAYNQLNAEAKTFLMNVDFPELSRRFQ